MTHDVHDLFFKNGHYRRLQNPATIQMGYFEDFVDLGAACRKGHWQMGSRAGSVRSRAID